ncbi:hypothetical protein RI054_23g99270 [Pseudoscourfieldia marina]
MSRFYVTLDGVMGGRSSGAVQTTQQGHLLFSGNINVLGGGFANIRTSIPTANFANSEGLVIEYVPRLQGEGDHGVSPLGVQVQVSDGRCACPKIAAFGLAPGAANGQKATAVVPTAAWENGKNQGWRSCSCDTDVTRITSIYLYVLFQEGSFQMELVNLRLLAPGENLPAVNLPTSSLESLSPSHGAAKTAELLINNAVERGVLSFNKGYPDICAAIYASALMHLATANDTPQSVKDSAKAALTHSAADWSTSYTGGNSARAWALRHIVDDAWAKAKHASTNPTASPGTDMTMATTQASSRDYDISSKMVTYATTNAKKDSDAASVNLGLIVAVTILATVLVMGGIGLAVHMRRKQIKSAEPVTVGVPVVAMAAAPQPMQVDGTSTASSVKSASNV